ncbi:hypothetical protein [Sporomusa sp. KB1]|uniref:hypothetical protein n=1 Tax=Sporomusa sp. KB1 TaxID=943346 RepID=UPI0011ACD428|nr:hypothetical protein [Sporomusa sp. KB1]TWH51857.1 hypothetical protein Salpa_0328 [Sporomusa sp. KB1]
MNRLKTVLLLATLTGLLLAIGNWFGGKDGMLIMFLVSVAMNFGSYWFSDKIVLNMYGAREVTLRILNYRSADGKIAGTGAAVGPLTAKGG